MKYYQDTQGGLAVITKGEELMDCLGKIAEDNNLKNGWMSALGGAGKMTLGFYNLEAREYIWREFNEPQEILSLQGNLAWVDGKPFWHVHGVFGGDNYQVIGGHVKELLVGLTCEVRITPLNEVGLTRTFDDETGLKLLAER